MDFIVTYIFGNKTTAFFDIWTIEHILSGLSIGSLVVTHTKRSFSAIFTDVLQGFRQHRKVITRFDIIAVLLAAYFWEAIEHYFETGLLGDRATYWFQGVEAWDNRLVSDPLMLIVGYMIVRRYPRLVWPARVCSIAWLAIHLFAFPHSMYLQELLARLL